MKAQSLPAPLPMQFREFNSRARWAYLSHQLAACGGCVARMAKLVGKDRKHLYKLLNKHDVDIDAIRLEFDPRAAATERRRRSALQRLKAETLTAWLQRRIAQPDQTKVIPWE